MPWLWLRNLEQRGTDTSIPVLLQSQDLSGETKKKQTDLSDVRFSLRRSSSGLRGREDWQVDTLTFQRNIRSPYSGDGFLFLVYLTAFSVTQTISYRIEWNDDIITMNSRGCGRKRSFPNLRFYPGICLEGLRKTTKASVRIAGLRAEVWAQDLPNRKKKS
jgi:hypothetical protein